MNLKEGIYAFGRGLLRACQSRQAQNIAAGTIIGAAGSAVVRYFESSKEEQLKNQSLYDSFFAEDQAKRDLASGHARRKDWRKNK